MQLTEDKALRLIQRRREAERRNDEREEMRQLAEARREKARREKEERPEVYWLKRLCWGLWIFLGVETVKCLAEMWPR